MIKVTILKSKERSLGFKIEGHALSQAEIDRTVGNKFDMICNSVSVLSQSSIIGLEEVLKLKTKYELKDGFINLNLSSHNEDEIDKAQVILLTFEKSIESLIMSIKHSFGKNKGSKYIILLKEEVPEIC